jgi:GH24 family phage-related lysozyme (muramidase)
MTITDDAYDLICKWEGFSPTWYTDAAGVDTIGYGVTRPLLESVSVASVAGPITKEEGCVLLEAIVTQHFAPKIARAFDRNLFQCQIDACTSLAYNIGAGTFQNSTLVRHYNAGEAEKAADAFLDWVYITDPQTGEKRVLDGLVNRRRDEKALAEQGNALFDVADVEEADRAPVADIEPLPGEVDMPTDLHAEATA